MPPLFSDFEYDRLRAQEPHERECGICYEKLDQLQAHDCIMCEKAYCANCMRSYIDRKVQEGLVSSRNLVCPTPGCSRALPEEQIEALAGSSTFQKYKTFLKNQTVGIRFCPRAGCCAVLEEPLHSRHRRVKCAACHEESCMRCGGEFHKVPGCRRMEKKLKRWKKQQQDNAGICPKCASVIEKNGGCQHMTCMLCQHQYCWKCQGPWESHCKRWCKWRTFVHANPRHCAPVRVVTTTAKVGATVVVVVVGATVGTAVAIVVVPPLALYGLLSR